ncbi:helix-turn-helix domain-containing protein [Bacillus marinisedimentorum]|uniref:helix-turn-helix domain-containing protein n=1 Tax=Bacillus marinisedimentorum TaxID=1821260 RepID=UPI0008731D5E|nr:helix-turn-helix transcriptional regulator [Bacillus marinisedimentorum]
MSTVSKNIEYYRKQAGMTRKDLAAGICDESTLYRIEKGAQNPRLDLLYDICRKLKVPIDFVISDLHYNDLMEIERYKNLCRELTYNEDYEALTLTIEEFDKLLDLYKHQAEYASTKRFITWHKAVLLHMKENNPAEAEDQLKSIYEQRLRTELDIGICNSLGLVKLNRQGVAAAINYFKKAYSAIEDLPFKSDFTLAPRVAYNLAYCHYYNGNLHEAITLAYKIIEMLEKKQLSFIMGKTKHMLGKINMKLGDYEQAREYLIEAKFLFRLEKNEAHYRKTEADLDEVQELIKGGN